MIYRDDDFYYKIIKGYNKYNIKDLLGKYVYISNDVNSVCVSYIKFEDNKYKYINLLDGNYLYRDTTTPLDSKGVEFESYSIQSIIDFQNSVDKFKSNNTFHKQLIQSAFEIYGEEHVDYYFKYPYFCIVIKFPEYNISNSVGLYRNLKDTYVVIKINTSNDRISLFGCVATQDFEAFNSSYGHSHLPNNRAVSMFCLGSGPLSIMLNDYSLNPDYEKALLIMYNIDSYLKWESIEGKPHMYLQDIVGKCYLKTNNPHDRFYISDSIINEDDLKNFPVSCVKYTKNNYPYIDFLADDFIDYVNSILLYKVNKDVICFIDSSNKFFTYNNSSYNQDIDKSFILESVDEQKEVYNTGIKLLLFKNEIVELKVYKNYEESKQTLRKTVNPKVLYSVAWEFTRKLRESFLKY